MFAIDEEQPKKKHEWWWQKVDRRLSELEDRPAKQIYYKRHENLYDWLSSGVFTMIGTPLQGGKPKDEITVNEAIGLICDHLGIDITLTADAPKAVVVKRKKEKRVKKG
jgi:hypothetical protein